MNSSFRVVLGLNLLLIILGLTPFYPWFSQVFQKTNERPILFLVSLNQKALAGINSLWQLPVLSKENQELRQKVNLLQSEQALKEEYLKENTLLRSQLKLKPRSNQTYILGKVLSQIEGDTLLLNVGRRQGVEVDQLVSRQRTLLGKVFKVEENRAEVLLTVSPKLRWEVRSEDFLTWGEASGLFGNKLKLSKVLPSQVLNPGQIFLERGSGLILGTVEKVDREGAKIFKEAEVRAPYDPTLIDEVFILRED